MKIRLHCNLGTNDFPESPLCEGEHDVLDSLGAKLVQLKLATDITPPSAPPEPESSAEGVAVEPPKLDRFETMRAKNKNQSSK